MTMIALESLDLAALLCSRVCHDVISPVGAILNGLEMLESEKDASMREFAFELVGKSAKQASARLQFARLAFGAAGSAGALIDLGDAENVARGFIEDDKTKLDWQAPRVLLPKNKVKLVLNLLLIAVSAIPRGGAITCKIAVDGDDCAVDIGATGTYARIQAKIAGLIAAEPEDGVIDAHTIQPYYTGMIARAAGMSVQLDSAEQLVTIKAMSAS